VNDLNSFVYPYLYFTVYSQVPFALIDGVQVNGSLEVINHISSLLSERGLVTDNGSEEDVKWVNWVDDHLIHLLPPNIYRTPSEAMQSFEYITTHGTKFSTIEAIGSKYIGAGIMYLIAKRNKKKYNIVGDEREALYNALNSWVEAVGDREFFGGQAPSKADIVVFGVLRSLSNLDTNKDIMQYSRIAPWYRRMAREVGNSPRIKN
jgi:microsomal prostaglandin-E synthase 2